MKKAISLLLRLSLVFVVAVFVTRSLVWLLPGNPIDLILAESGTTLQREELSAAMGIQNGYWASMLHSFKSLAHFDLGISIHSREAVSEIVARKLSVTAKLVACTTLFATALSLALGLAAAMPGNSLVKRVSFRLVSLASIIGASSSSTWLGPLLLILFALKWPIFQLTGSFALAMLVLSVPFIGFWSRLIRDRSRESYRHPSVTVALSRGTSEFSVLIKYVLAPISGSLIAFLMTQIGHLLSGAFITEYVFSLNGMGSLLIESVLKRDYPVIEGAILFSSMICIVFTIFGELLQKTLDPRIEEGAQTS